MSNLQIFIKKTSDTSACFQLLVCIFTWFSGHTFRLFNIMMERRIAELNLRQSKNLRQVAPSLPHRYTRSH